LAAETRRVRQGEAAGRGQRRIFAEAVPGDEPRLGGQRPLALGLQHLEDRLADRHQRRLGVLGQGEIAFRPFEHQLGELLLQRVIDLLEDVSGGRKGLGQGAAHAGGLRSLTRENESADHLTP
jgi:hypothetical protein